MKEAFNKKANISTNHWTKAEILNLVNTLHSVHDEHKSSMPNRTYVKPGEVGFCSG